MSHRFERYSMGHGLPIQLWCKRSQMKNNCREPCCVVSRTREWSWCHLFNIAIVEESFATMSSSSNPSIALCLTQDIPCCTTFHCCSVILDRVPASSCQDAPINTHPTPKSSLCRGHSRSVSFLSLPQHARHTHIRCTSRHSVLLLLP